MVTDLVALMEGDIATDAVEEGFITVPTPTTDPTPDSDFACVVCGKDVSHIYKRRVKEPRCEEHKKSGGASRLGSAKSTRSGGKDVEAAVAALDMAYNALTLGLMVAGAHKAMGALQDSLPGLQTTNRNLLSQDPELARRIAAMGKTGGRYAFFGAQVMTLGPVAILAFAELSEKWSKPKNRTVNDFDAEMPATFGGFPVE